VPGISYKIQKYSFYFRILKYYRFISFRYNFVMSCIILFWPVLLCPILVVLLIKLTFMEQVAGWQKNISFFLINFFIFLSLDTKRKNKREKNTWLQQWEEEHERCWLYIKCNSSRIKNKCVSFYFYFILLFLI
jgi:hypothetical protein